MAAMSTERCLRTHREQQYATTVYCILYFYCIYIQETVVFVHVYFRVYTCTVVPYIILVCSVCCVGDIIGRF